MSHYVDGFVLPVPKDNIEAYRELATLAGQIWIEHGALEYIECLADDVTAGTLTSFPRAVKLEENETVVFAWIVYESREHRDRVNSAVMADKRLAGPDDMPFDGKRLIYGGFAPLVTLRR